MPFIIVAGKERNEKYENWLVVGGFLLLYLFCFLFILQKYNRNFIVVDLIIYFHILLLFTVCNRVKFVNTYIFYACLFQLQNIHQTLTHT